MLPLKYSFSFVSKSEIAKTRLPLKLKRKKAIKPKIKASIKQIEPASEANRKRMFLKLAGMVGLGVVASTLLPQKAEALVFGGAPATSTVGLKNASNAPINPATDESVTALSLGLEISKKSVTLASTGTVHTPGSGKKIRIYNLKFSLSADLTDLSFRFTSGGTDFEKYLTPKAGGLYGANNQPNFFEGEIDQALYCVINGSATVQINFDYLEI